MLGGVTAPERPWWKTLTGYPAWMAADQPWHGWAFASASLLLFSLLAVIAPKHLVAAPMVGASISALMQAIRVRNGARR